MAFGAHFNTLSYIVYRFDLLVVLIQSEKTISKNRPPIIDSINFMSAQNTVNKTVKTFHFGRCYRSVFVTVNFVIDL